MNRLVTLLIAAALLAAGCSSDETSDLSAATGLEQPETADGNDSESTISDVDSEDASSEDGADTTDQTSSGDTSAFQIEVWADNWMAVYVNGELIGEDSDPITTERSFNAETFTFEATYPFTLAIEAKDFKETDSGIEYIGKQNQQMGDGGIIAQVTDTSSGEVIAWTDSSWNGLVSHRAPLNTQCESDPDPDATCEFEIIEAPTEWAASNFDSSTWASATEWSAADVGPKDGYDEIGWDDAAQLIWGTDLEVDNTILFRTTITN